MVISSTASIRHMQYNFSFHSFARSFILWFKIENSRYTYQDKDNKVVRTYSLYTWYMRHETIKVEIQTCQVIILFDAKQINNYKRCVFDTTSSSSLQSNRDLRKCIHIIQCSFSAVHIYTHVSGNGPYTSASTSRSHFVFCFSVCKENREFFLFYFFILGSNIWMNSVFCEWNERETNEDRKSHSYMICCVYSVYDVLWPFPKSVLVFVTVISNNSIRLYIIYMKNKISSKFYTL